MGKHGDWIKVASHIMNIEKHNQPIIIFRAEFVLPFKYYYKGINKIIPISRRAQHRTIRYKVSGSKK